MKESRKPLSEEALIALELRKQLSLPSRVDLEALAGKLRLGIFDVPSVTFEGALLRSSRKLAGRILIRKDIRELGRRRFTLAHEIGHFFLHGDVAIPCMPRVIEGWRDGQPEPERQADAFASELLLPTQDVVACVGKRWPSLQVVSDIAELFGTSLMAAARKYCDVAEQSCAVIWVSKGQIRWFHPSPSFAFFVQVGKQVGFDSFARRALEGKRVPEEMEEVPAADWISSYWLREDAVVSEQTVAVPFYAGSLSLVWVRRPIEDKPSDEDELLPELDPTGFTINRTRWPR